MALVETERSHSNLIATAETLMGSHDLVDFTSPCPAGSTNAHGSNSETVTRELEESQLNSATSIEEGELEAVQIINTEPDQTVNDPEDFVPSKRARLNPDVDDPSVHVIFNSLTRNSKRKLQELLGNWSEWHAYHHSSGQNENECEESGKMTYYPSLHLHTGDTEASSTMCFWKESGSSSLTVGGREPPVYDRGFVAGLALGAVGDLEVDPTRCFNCGMYGHPLKECTRPVDSAAVITARNEHKSKRFGPRTPTRYYQDSPNGKYDGLRPGALHADTRKLLGLKEFDPPPWLHRMRELGYPPGYLDPDTDDLPSGIVIHSDSVDVEPDVESGEPNMKMSVEFPGINAPVPDGADGRMWVRPRHDRSRPVGGPSPVRSSHHESYAYGPPLRASYPLVWNPIGGWSTSCNDRPWDRGVYGIAPPFRRIPDSRVSPRSFSGGYETPRWGHRRH